LLLIDRFRVLQSPRGRVNRQNLKIINFEHALHPRLGLETNNMNTECRR
jgi:hypothetical protein